MQPEKAARLQPLSIPNLSASVEQHVREAIITGIFKPGERLVESTIADQLGVSRAPIREVLSALEREGLIVRVPRRGSFVISFTDRDISEIYSLRLILEVAALRRAVDRVTPTTLARMQEIVDALGEAAHQGIDSADVVAKDMDFHQAICAVADHTRLCMMWNSMRWQTQLLIGLTTRTHYAHPHEPHQFHQRILDAVRAQDAALAEATLTEHILDGEQRAYAAMAGVEAERARASVDVPEEKAAEVAALVP